MQNSMAWREFKELEGLSVDVAMFPVDNRLEDAMEWGAIEFLRRVQVKKAFIPMHLNGPLWTPSVYFKSSLWRCSCRGASKRCR